MAVQMTSVRSARSPAGAEQRPGWRNRGYTVKLFPVAPREHSTYTQELPSLPSWHCFPRSVNLALDGTMMTHALFLDSRGVIPTSLTGRFFVFVFVMKASRGERPWTEPQQGFLDLVQPVKCAVKTLPK